MTARLDSMHRSRLTKHEARSRGNVRQFETLQDLVRRLTNWQRNGWARAGYPTKRAEIERLLDLPRTAGS